MSRMCSPQNGDVEHSHAKKLFAMIPSFALQSVVTDGSGFGELGFGELGFGKDGMYGGWMWRCVPSKSD
jgi:hypothetical protein